jgi:peptidoglycan/xylan/chitin deacetylase (PgdA/CDA1 family)
MATKKLNKIKRLIKVTISLLALFYARVANGLLTLAGKKPRATCVVLYYHAVSTVDRRQFAWQMDELLRLTTPIAASNRQDLKPGLNYAAVTFDDAVQSVVVNAIPELLLRNIPATIFVVVNFVGGTPKWATYGPEYDDQDRIITLEQLKSLREDLFTIGSHTLSHPWLPSLSESEARIELMGSRNNLGALLDREIKLFSFPYGAMSDELVTWCEQAGYERVFTIVPTHAFSDAREFVSGRITADPGDWRLEFRLKLLGAYQWLHLVYRFKKTFLSKSLIRKPKLSKVF